MVVEFHCTCSISSYYIVFIIIIVFILGDRPSGLLIFFMPALLLCLLSPLVLPSSVSLSYFILAVPML